MMIFPKPHSLKTLGFISLASLILSACMPSTSTNVRTRTGASVSASSNVGMYQGKILADNPIILTNNYQLSENIDLNRLVSVDAITSNVFLKGGGNCYNLDYCFEVRQNKESPSALQTTDGKWSYSASTPEFLQVNTFYHLNKISELFYGTLDSTLALAYNGLTPQYDTAIPLGLKDSLTSKFKVGSTSLMAYADCDTPDNAYFKSSTNSLCFGYMSAYSNVKWAQDSTVIYHEAGHYFQKLQLNFRNYDQPTKVDMGGLSYDEAGAIGEGLSDFYSYFVNGRSHFAEWAAGRFLNASRPMSESDSLHAPGISTDIDRRLSYPAYLDYNPNDAEIPTEDIHVSGMIISHYLTALSSDLQETCGYTKKDSTIVITHLINETLAELGDLTSIGTELKGAANKINLSASYSKEWLTKVNPINYRSFMQTFAKNLKNTVGTPSMNMCNGNTYTQDQIESLIDSYGLLLFRTYNEHRNLTNSTTLVNTAVNSLNRKKTQMINKDKIIVDPTVGSSVAFVVDNRDQIKSGVASLQADGLVSISSQTPSDLGFNNGNGKVSPGEIVGIALNLYNNSNTVMGGVQILANDWNHTDYTSNPTYGKPCQFPSTLTSDKWPLTTEGGATCNSVAAAANKDFTPICFIQSNETSSTRWVTQKEFKNKLALNDSLCLDPSNDKDCFIRALKGADQAYYSRINPGETWGKSLADPKTGAAPLLNWGNLILFEVSKHIPPGTVIDCRFRVRFTNCEDCFHDASNNNNDYKDVDYNGPKPYKIIHLQIPITD
jgi:hypothetical protein